MQNEEYEARFAGVARLFGRAGLERLRHARVAVIGLGGVGSWAVEALARSGVGALTLVDLDEVCVSNVNRQLHAIEGTVGRAKAGVMTERVRAIHPGCQCRAIAEFFNVSNADDLLGAGLDAVVDAIDSPEAKALLLAGCKARRIFVVACGASGGRRDGTSVRLADLRDVTHDRLLAGVRKRLRREHGFSQDGTMGVDCVYSPEPPVFPQPDGTVCAARHPDSGEEPLRLDCERGYGAAAFVTGAFGLAAAGRVVRHLAEECPVSG
jgi:tRNA A37 threonylcarbamoyladenosine dehydratase